MILARLTPPSSAGGPAAASPVRPGASAFTMIEIALSLAIIAFALVTIIGILPMGMNVQRENREETIINQDAAYWMETLRGGARGLDDLTNYVAAIVIQGTDYDLPNMGTVLNQGSISYTNPTLPLDFSVPTPLSPYQLIDGQRIVGLLSTPKYQIISPTLIRSNYVVAYVTALSGSAAEKYPQNNQSVQELAFKYKLTSEVVTCETNVPYNASLLRRYPAFSPVSGPFPETLGGYSNYWQVARSLLTNLHEVRLTFRWPLHPDGVPRNTDGRQSFRAMVGGQMTNWFATPSVQLHFVESRTYRQGPLP